MEKLDFLIRYLLEENQTIKLKDIPNDIEEKENLWHSLCNIREAKPISDKYISIENEYLKTRLSKMEITKVENIKTIGNSKYNNKICLWKGDITTLKIDAIVNAANSQGLGCFIPCHKCIDNQINTYAGIPLRLECDKIMKEKGYFLPTGEAFITNGYNLPSKYVIHTVGPIIYDKVTKIEEDQLMECYINSLKIAIENNIRTIAFPCISTGEFCFPKKVACKLAISAVREFLKGHEKSFEKIVFNVYGEEDYHIYERELKQ